MNTWERCKPVSTFVTIPKYYLDKPGTINRGS